MPQPKKSKNQSATKRPSSIAPKCELPIRHLDLIVVVVFDNLNYILNDKIFQKSVKPKEVFYSLSHKMIIH